MNTKLYLINPDVTFLTASERSLRGLTFFIQHRFTHRLSFAERQRRIDFVRNRHIAWMYKTLQEQTQVIDLDRMDPTRATALLSPYNSLTYNKGRLKVHSISLLGEIYTRMGGSDLFEKRFSAFWRANVQARLLSRVLHQIRRVFGSDCLRTGVLTPTPQGYREIISFLRFGKPYRELSQGKRNRLQSALTAEVYQLFQRGHHPMVNALYRRVDEIRAWIDSVRTAGLVAACTSDPSTLDSFTSRMPNFNGALLGMRQLSDLQMAKLRGRKVKMKRYFLWSLFYKVPCIKRMISISHDIRFVYSLNFNELIAYVPYAKTIDRAEQGKPPLLKFITPSVVQHQRQIKILDQMGYIYKGSSWMPINNWPSLLLIQDDAIHRAEELNRYLLKRDLAKASTLTEVPESLSRLDRILNPSVQQAALYKGYNRPFLGKTQGKGMFYSMYYLVNTPKSRSS